MGVQGWQHVRVSPQGVNCGDEVIPPALWVEKHELIVYAVGLAPVAELADGNESFGWEKLFQIFLT